MSSSRLIPLCGALAMAAWTTLLRAQDVDSVRITTTRVADGVYLLQGSGGNVGVSAGGDGVFVIDDQYAPLSARIRTAIQAIGPGPIRFVINTHWHGDHTGGNESFGKDGVLIAAHENVRGCYPFIDASTGGTLDGMIVATDRILAIAGDETRIIPGHGALATRADLRRYRDLLATVRLRLTPALREGKTAEQVAGADLLADLDAIWGHGFLTPAQFVTIACQSMARR